MAYSIVGIANMALQRLGSKSRITALTDGTPNAIKVNTVWEYIRDEVIEDIKPKFATLRVALSQSATSPANTDQYEFAYPLPSDFLCFADGSKDDLPIWPADIAPFSVETLSATDSTQCLMTNYDSTEASYAVFVTYVKRITDVALWTPSAISALAFRLAAELTFAIVEHSGKFEAMMTLYDAAARKAKAKNRAKEYLEDEKDNSDWEQAGRA